MTTKTARFVVTELARNIVVAALDTAAPDTAAASAVGYNSSVVLLALAVAAVDRSPQYFRSWPNHFDRHRWQTKHSPFARERPSTESSSSAAYFP